MRVVDVLHGAKPLKHGARVRFHQGTAEILGRVALIGPLDATGGLPAIAPGARAFVRLRLERPARPRRAAIATSSALIRRHSPSPAA